MPGASTEDDASSTCLLCGPSSGGRTPFASNCSNFIKRGSVWGQFPHVIFIRLRSAKSYYLSIMLSMHTDPPGWGLPKTRAGRTDAACALSPSPVSAGAGFYFASAQWIHAAQTSERSGAWFGLSCAGSGSSLFACLLGIVPLTGTSSEPELTHEEVRMLDAVLLSRQVNSSRVKSKTGNPRQ